MALQSEILMQIDGVLARHKALRAQSSYNDCSDQPDQEVTSLITLIADAIRRFAPPTSQYMESMREILKEGVRNPCIVPHMAGVLSALREAYESGYLATVGQLLRAEVFADFLEMAEHLLSEGYKDPAAVLIGRCTGRASALTVCESRRISHGL
jgi:hypothetical protein